MNVQLVSVPQDFCGVVLRFLPAEAPVSFGTPDLQQCYEAHFSGDPLTLSHKEVRSLRLPWKGGFCTLLLAGFDSGVPHPMDDLRTLTAKLGTALAAEKAAQVYLDGTEALTFASEDAILLQITSTLPLCEYVFDQYLSRKAERIERTLFLRGDPSLSSVCEEGLALARAVMTARDLVNDIAAVLTPEELARRCTLLGRQHGFSVDVLDRTQCQALGMHLFLAVAQGSRLDPRFIIMRWHGGGDEPPIALVGKGITYDSGGLAIKTSGMESMRFDMNGAAAVIGAMCAIAGRRLSRNVVAVVAACENMVDANSYRNGDVFPSMNGQTVFVRNTDAEGRLTMADAITYCIRKEAPSQVIEVAGLTGSVCNFYGKYCAAALTTEQSLFDQLTSLMEVTGEKYAQMPTFDEYRELLKTPYADLNNAPEGGMGGILAGLFLAAFHENTPFLHIDFGATPFTKSKSDGQPEGATGFGVKTLYHYVKAGGGLN